MYPGQSVVLLVKNYHIKKWKLIFTILGITFLIGISVYIKNFLERQVTEAGIIVREEVAQGDYEIEIKAIIDEIDMKENFTLYINERRMNKEEMEALYIEFFNSYQKRILGNNTSFENIIEDFKFLEKIDNYPFLVQWRSQNQKILDNEGKINNIDLEEACDVELYIDIYYLDYRWQEIILCTILPAELTEKERVKIKIKQMIEVELKKNQEEKEIILPQEIDEMSIKWKEKRNNIGFYIWSLGLFTSFIIYFSADQDLYKLVKLKKENMRREYPYFVKKLALYLEAGLTIRAAYQKIAFSKIEEKNNPNYLYSEMKYAYHQLEAGVSEIKVYDDFGKRTDMKEYIRLSTLLIQNLKRGNTALVKALREEAKDSFKEEVRNRKTLSEESVTKQLFPMIIMLAVVMILVITPAFGGLTF